MKTMNTLRNEKNCLQFIDSLTTMKKPFRNKGVVNYLENYFPTSQRLTAEEASRDPDNRDYGLSREEIIAKRKVQYGHNSYKKGMQTHGFITACLKGEHPEATLPAERAFLRWWRKNSKKYIFLKSDVEIRSKKYDIMGQIDALLFDRESQELTIVEFKSSEQEFDKDHMFKPPFDQMEFTVANLAVMQANFYRVMLNEYTPERIGALVVHLDPSGRYKEIEVSNLTAETKKALQSITLKNKKYYYEH